MRPNKRVINFPNKKAQNEVTAPVEEEKPPLEIPKRPAFIPKKYAVEWAEMCIELMGRKRWSMSMMPLLEATMVSRIVFDETTDLMEKLEAQKLMMKNYRHLDLLPKRDPGQVGRPRREDVDRYPSGGIRPDQPDEITKPRWGAV